MPKDICTHTVFLSFISNNSNVRIRSWAKCVVYKYLLNISHGILSFNDITIRHVFDGLKSTATCTLSCRRRRRSC